MNDPRKNGLRCCAIGSMPNCRTVSMKNSTSWTTSGSIKCSRSWPIARSRRRSIVTSISGSCSTCNANSSICRTGRHHRQKVVAIFEVRDFAGKGGVIKRITQRLNPRVCRVAALPAPTGASAPSGTSSVAAAKRAVASHVLQCPHSVDRNRGHAVARHCGQLERPRSVGTCRASLIGSTMTRRGAI